MKIEIRRARLDEADVLTDLAMRSKQSNGYDDAFMTACRDELTVTKEWLQSAEHWVADNGTICGCACLTIDSDGLTGEVHSFFIDPDWQQRGIGNLLWRKVLDRAKANKLSELRLDADPHAVPFYQKLGFKTVGQVPSGSIEGRHIPHMKISLDEVL